MAQSLTNSLLLSMMNPSYPVAPGHDNSSISAEFDGPRTRQVVVRVEGK